MSLRTHWQQVYLTKPDAELSWFQAHPERSLAIIEAIAPPPRRAIDVGGGQSSLAGELLRLGVEEVTVLDISDAALERARARLGGDAGRVRWLAADVLDAADLDPVDLWHDRAVFHFLTDPADRTRYADIAARTVAQGGTLVLATFGPDGPERCSGLPVHRSDAESIAAAFAPAFEPVSSDRESHLTPWGKPQSFVYASLRRR